MLDSAQKFERAFERFEDYNSNFRIELELGEGLPTEDDWKIVRSLRQFLEHFYEHTLRVSNTLYVISNILFNKLAEMNSLLQDAQCNDDVEFGVMAIRMKDKYDKYWGNMEKINMLIFVAVVLDPRQIKLCGICT